MIDLNFYEAQQMSELKTANLSLRTATLRINRLLAHPTLDIPATSAALSEAAAALRVIRQAYGR